MRTTKIAGALFAVALGAPAAFAAPPDHLGSPPPSTASSHEPLSRAELQILAHLQHTDRAEIELGRLAQARAASPEVKRYGRMLVEDHTQNLREVTSFARARDQEVPEVRPTDESDRARMAQDDDTAAKLHDLDGRAFDRAFVHAMMAGHDEALAELGTQLDTASDPELATLLRKTKPVLEKHRKVAQDLMTQLDDSSREH